MKEQSTKDQVMSMVAGGVVSRAIHVAAELGIADAIGDDQKHFQEVATAVNADSRSLFRLLRMLTSHGFFQEKGEGEFSLTPLGQTLRSDSSESLHDLILQEDELCWKAIGNLKAAIVNGIPAFDHIYGKSYFEYLAVNPEVNARFEAGMSNLTEDENIQISQVIQLEQAKKVVDVGGGRGGFLASLLRHHKHLEGILYELPHVVFSNESLLFEGVEDRCEVVSGSFFDQLPEGAGVYLLKRVLCDWDDEACGVLLSNCLKAMNSEGKIYIIESIMPETGGARHLWNTDIYMMALFSGRERTEQEYRDLLAHSGLMIDRIIPTDSELSIIEVVEKR